jgi:hypothetical protein
MGNTPSQVARPMLTAAEVPSLPLVSHYVYALLALHVYKEPDQRPLPAGWTVLMECSDVSLDREGYFGVAYINDALGHCVIAERGTADALGVRAALWMLLDEPTIQFALSEQFSKVVRLRLQLTRDGDAPYALSYTGHSLGAVLAACRACAEHTFAVTFESPGCRNFVQQTMHPFRADDVDVVCYVRQPNPINSLRPHCGYLVQLPHASAPPAHHTTSASSAAAASDAARASAPTNAPESPAAGAAPSSTAAAAAAKGGSAAVVARGDKVATSLLQNVKRSVNSVAGFHFVSPQDYIRSKVLEQSAPEVQAYLSKVEPILRDLLDRTRLLHSIAGIVDSLAEDDARRSHDVVMVWPNNAMQFLEYFNLSLEMEKPENQDTHVYAAFRAMVSKFYQTDSRPKNKLPIRNLNRDSQKLVNMWLALPERDLASFPLSALERRALNTISFKGEMMSSSVMTAFQMKQYLALIVRRPAFVALLDGYAVERVSKL